MDEGSLEGWARASVRIKADDVGRVPLPPELSCVAELSRNGRVLSFVFPNQDEVRLHALLKDVTRFLREHSPTLAQLRGVEIDLFLGWSPKADQESTIVDAELIGILGRLNASICFDTYNE